MSEIGDKIFFLFQRGDPLVFSRFSKSHYAYVDRLWQTEMDSQTSLTVEIVVSKDVWISKKLSGNKFWVLAWLFIELYGSKLEQVKKTPPHVTTSFQSPFGIGLRGLNFLEFFHQFQAFSKFLELSQNFTKYSRMLRVF